MRAKTYAVSLIAVFVLLVSVFGEIATANARTSTTGAPAGGTTWHPGRGAALDICATVTADSISHPSTFRYGINGETLQNDFYDKENGLNAQGYRPVRVIGYMDGKNVRFATKWDRDGGPGWSSWFGKDGQFIDDKYNELKDTHRVTDVSGYNTPDGVRYNIVFEVNANGYNSAFHRDVPAWGMEWLSQYYTSVGFAPIRIEGYTLNGQPHFISAWVKVPDNCRFKLHVDMDRNVYQNTLDTYIGQNLRLIHLDSYPIKGRDYYAGIWLMQDGQGYQVRSNRDWYLFQRFANNFWCDGFRLTNLYASDLSGSTVRYGGIWTYHADLQIDENSSFAARIRKQIDCAEARGGAAVVNLTTGEQVMTKADQSFGASSTIKSAILYALLRKADDEGFTLNTVTLNVGTQYGGNQGDTLSENTSFSLAYLAGTMIENSNNWATNRLIDFVGVDQINAEMSNLGLQQTRIRRYMMGSGSPSMNGNSGPRADYLAGIDNTSTPGEMVSLLQQVHQNNGLLSQNSSDLFWNIMSLSGNTKGNVNSLLTQGVGGDWQDRVTFFNKAGSNGHGWDSDNNPINQLGDFAHRPQIGPHLQRSEAGRMVFDDGQVVFYAIFMDEADGPVATALAGRMACFGLEIVREYSGQTSGDNPVWCD